MKKSNHHHRVTGKQCRKRAKLFPGKKRSYIKPPTKQNPSNENNKNSNFYNVKVGGKGNKVIINESNPLADFLNTLIAMLPLPPKIKKLLNA